ncbi:hypothetical protein ACNKHW_07830 [Shigella flexneri]
MMSAQKTLSRTGVRLERHELCSDLRPAAVGRLDVNTCGLLLLPMAA